MPRVGYVSAAQSVISTDTTIPAADGVEVTTIYITVKQEREEGGEPLPVAGLPAARIVVSVSGTGNTVTQPTGVTDASGNITASYVSTVAQTKTISVTVCGRAATNSPTVNQGGSGGGSGLFFSDDFAGTQKNPSGAFTYDSTGSRVSVVSFDTYNCLRFRYGPDATGADSSAEQRFNMGQNLSELWLEYYLHIPSNFALRNDSPFNNKFLALWPTSYSTIGDTYVVTEFERNGTDTSYARMLGYGDMFYADGTVIRGGNAIQNSNFISAARANAWHRIRVHYKLASGAGQTDGVYEGYVGNDLLWRSRTDWVFWSTGGNNFVRNGYFMGWANSGYTAETDFHIRALRFHNTDPGWTF